MFIHKRCWGPRASQPLCPQATDNPAASELFTQQLRSLREKDGFSTVLFSCHVRKVRSVEGLGLGAKGGAEPGAQGQGGVPGRSRGEGPRGGR